jgi:hypothetical protein
VIFNSHMFNAPRFNSEKDVSLNFLFTLNETNTCVALPNAVPSVITTIMDQKVQLINPLNLGELYAA